MLLNRQPIFAKHCHHRVWLAFAMNHAARKTTLTAAFVCFIKDLNGYSVAALNNGATDIRDNLLGELFRG